MTELVGTGGALNISHIKGDTMRAIDFVLDDDGTPIDLTGYNIEMHVRPYANGDLLVRYTLGQGHFALTNAANGEFQFTQKLVDIPAGRHEYDIQLTSSAGVIDTYVKGVFEVVQDVTW